jgi:ribosome recycling factor
MVSGVAMPTQMSIRETQETYQAMRLCLRTLTADERRQEEVVKVAAEDARKERKKLKAIREEKRTAEDKCELYRAQHDLEV